MINLHIDDVPGLRSARVCAAIVALVCGLGVTAPGTQASPLHPNLHFEINHGQFPPDVGYVARGPGYSVALGSAGVSYLLDHGPNRRRIDVSLVDGATPSVVEALEPLSGHVNYFIGNDPANWLTGVETYRAVIYRDVYIGIDMRYRANDGAAEYDLIVAAGGDPSRISLAYDGARGLSIGVDGELVIESEHGVLTTAAPIAYKDGAAGTEYVSAAFRIVGRDRVQFALGA